MTRESDGHMSETPYTQESLDALAEIGAYALANMADCGCPDNVESYGARFLLGIRDDVIERAGYGEVDTDVVHEIADAAPNIYTYQKWQEFVDLQAYHEDPSELSGDSGDMDSLASICLYIIAERLAAALIEELELVEGADEDEDA